MEKKFVKPSRKGLLVRFPDKYPAKYLAEEGENVTWGNYWIRSLRRGDVELGISKKPSFKKTEK